MKQHISLYHNADRGFALTKKQLRVCRAMYDNDVFVHGQGQGRYLLRSAAAMRETIQPPVSLSANNISDDIRLLLDVPGPRFVNRRTLGDELPARQVRNTYYTRGFAEALSCMRCVVVYISMRINVFFGLGRFS